MTRFGYFLLAAAIFFAWKPSSIRIEVEITTMRFSDDMPGFFLGEEPASDHSEVLVVFVGQTECRHLRWLKQGFRHCFIALRRGDRWLVCDSLKNQIEFSLIDLPSNFDLGEFYRNRGYTVVVGQGLDQEQPRPFIPEILTCVTIAKRIIGIRSFWTFTPWQLFCLLISMNDRWRLVR